MFDPNITVLSLLETRVLGVLIEKQATTPDNYPLTLNSLVSGCNQKSSRDPVLSATDDEVQDALDSLKRYSLVMEGSGSRVTRYEHNANRVLKLTQPFLAILAILMLRGPQTPGELRINTERIYRFADISALEVHLEELMTRKEGALITKLPKLPGGREHRFAHLLSGPVSVETIAATMAPSVAGSDIATSELAVLKTSVAQLKDEMLDLRAQIDRLYQELGVARN